MTRTKVQKLSDRHEKDIASQIPGSYLTCGSGNNYDKSDVGTYEDNSTFQPQIECKCTQKLSYSVTLSLWQELKERAIQRGIYKKPTLAIRFYSPEEQVLEDLIVISKDDYLELLHSIKGTIW